MGSVSPMFPGRQPNRRSLDNLSGNDSSGVDNSGGGGYSGGMETRIGRLEAHVEHIQLGVNEIRLDIRDLRDAARTDFRILFGAIIAVALGLAGIMAKGFHWL